MGLGALATMGAPSPRTTETREEYIRAPIQAFNHEP
jgi:hypothetical protein